MKPKTLFGVRRGVALNSASRFIISRSSERASHIINVAVCAFLSLWLIAEEAFVGYGAQAQVVSIGILHFQDESGASVPSSIGQKIAQDLQQKLNANFKDLLARTIGAGEDASSIKSFTVEQLAALGKKNGVKFIVRGGLLAVKTEREVKTSVQLYADIVSVDTASINSTRVEGAGVQDSAAPTGETASALAQALSLSIEQLASSIHHQAILSPAAKTQSEDSNNAAQTNNSADATQADAAQAQDTAAAEADEELQQLISQAEALMAGGSSMSAESLSSLSHALEALKTALASKAALLEQAKDTAQADQDIAARKRELQTTVSSILQQVSSSDVASTEQAQPTGEKKNILAAISGYLAETVNILQKIQEIRALFRSAREESSNETATPPTGETTTPATDAPAPAEEAVAEVSGVVTEDGKPAEGVDITESESGATAKTDSNGSYTLPHVLSGKLAKLVVSKAGKQLGVGHVDLPRGRSAVADFDFGSKTGGGSVVAPRIIPSTVLLNSANNLRTSTGTVTGVVRDAQGNPVARALVSLKGLAMARTDSQGKYVFMNVPAGNHQLTIFRSGLRLKSEQLRVAAKENVESKTQFASNDRIAKEANKVVIRGTGTVVRGLVLDNEKRPVAGAKITVMQSSGAVSVQTGPKGNYELRDLKPGLYRVLISRVGYDFGTQTCTLSNNAVEQRDFQLKKTSSPLMARVFEKQRAERIEGRNQVGVPKIQLSPTETKKGQLTGRVVDAQGGKPIQGATISIQGQTTAKTDRDGNYALINLLPGTYRVNAKSIGFVEQETKITIQAGSPTRQQFVLRAERGADNPRISVKPQSAVEIRTGQLRGRVTDAKTGKPVAGATISISGQRGVTTNQEGIYIVANLVPGSYGARAGKNGFSDEQRTALIRAGETVTADFRLNPKPGPPILMKFPKGRR